MFGSICSGKHCHWCGVCLESDESISCDNCLKEAITEMLFNKVIKESY